MIDTISFCQVVKLPLLVKHYQEHKALNPTMDWVDFLSMHYWGNDINDNDSERDQQLPFKTMQLQQIACLQSHFELPKKVVKSWFIEKQSSMDKPRLYSYRWSISLLRPPQVEYI